MKYDLTKEKPPHPLMKAFQSEFLDARCKEYREIIKDDPCSDLCYRLLHEWSGYCEPYGFEILGILAEKLISARDNGHTDEAFQISSEINSYLNSKRDQIYNKS